MAGNRNLNSAARAKKDKFYTQIDDLAEEVRHCKNFFNGKRVLCNCDAPIAGKEINLFPDGKTAYSLEMNELREQADVVVTNPPFSMFREFLAWIFDADKKFLVIGNVFGMVGFFESPYEDFASASEHREDIPLWAKYSPEKNPRYDKYNPDQFEIIGMTENLDLYGLKTRTYTAQECCDRYFELFGKLGTYDLNAAGVINGKKIYQRILIRRRKIDA